MTGLVSDIAFTPSVKAVQERKGSRGAYAKMDEKGGWTDVITDDLAAFIGAQEFFLFGHRRQRWPVLHPAPGRAQGVPQSDR